LAGQDSQDIINELRVVDWQQMLDFNGEEVKAVRQVRNMA
jgi:hypothetical protein